MLQAIDDLSGITVLDNSTFGGWVNSLSNSYLSTYHRDAIIKQSEGKYHLVDLVKIEDSFATRTLKVASYCTLVLPLIAYTISSLTSIDTKDHHYFYENPKAKTSAFVKAVVNSDLPTMRALYIFNPDVIHTKNAHGETPFIIACHHSNLDIINWLYDVSNGSVIHDKDSESNTAFMLACYEGNFTVAEYLFEKTQGAVLKDKDSKGYTAFLRCCEEGFSDAAAWLYNKSNGSVLADTTNDGKTTLTIVQGSDFVNMEELLSKLVPNSGISPKIDFNPLLSSHLPRQIYDYAKAHHLFSKDLSVQVKDTYDAITICKKSSQQGEKTANLSIVLYKLHGNIQNQPNECFLLEYLPADLKKGFSRLMCTFENHRVTGITFFKGKESRTAENLSWGEQQEIIKSILENILPQFVN